MTPATLEYQAAQRPASDAGRPGWLLWALGGGFLLMLLAALGLGALLLGGRAGGVLGMLAPSPTPTPAPTNTPFRSPAAASPGLTGKQALTPSHLFDDFSSNALGWWTGTNTAGWARLEQGGYTIGVTAADNGVYAKVPLDNPPNHIEFTAQLTAGQESGFYVVRCLAQSEVNYYEVWIDPASQSYRMIQMDNSKRQPLTAWTPATSFAPGGAQIANRVAIDCQPGLISLYLNGSLAGEQQIKALNGKMYLLVLTYADMKESVEVRFDDVEAWEQNQ